MKGVNKTRRMRQEALAKMERGEPLTQAESALLGAARISAAGRTIPKPIAPFSKNTAKVDPDGKKTGISDHDMHAIAARVADHPAVLDLLSVPLVSDNPNATFSHQAVQLLAQAGTPDTEIARLIGIDVKTLRAEAADALELGNTQHRVTLRVGQYRAAMIGDRSLLIWLGKQSLGQVDRAVNEISGRDGKPIEVQDGATEVRGKLMRLIAMGQTQEGEVVAPAALPSPTASDAGEPQ